MPRQPRSRATVHKQGPPGLVTVLCPLPEPGPADTAFKNVLKFFTYACVAMSPHIPSPLLFLLSLLSHQEWSRGRDWRMRSSSDPRDPAVLLPPLSPELFWLLLCHRRQFMKGTVHVGHMSKGTAPQVLSLCHSLHSGGASSAEGVAVRLQAHILTGRLPGCRQEQGKLAPGNLGACHHGNASILGKPE